MAGKNAIPSDKRIMAYYIENLKYENGFLSQKGNKGREIKWRQMKDSYLKSKGKKKRRRKARRGKEGQGDLAPG